MHVERAYIHYLSGKLKLNPHRDIILQLAVPQKMEVTNAGETVDRIGTVWDPSWKKELEQLLGNQFDASSQGWAGSPRDLAIPRLEMDPGEGKERHLQQGHVHDMHRVEMSQY